MKTDSNRLPGVDYCPECAYHMRWRMWDTKLGATTIAKCERGLYWYDDEQDGDDHLCGYTVEIIRTEHGVRVKS